MEKTDEDKHVEEWKDIQKRFLSLVKVEDNSDPNYYKSRCVQGLIDGTTYDYN